MATLVHKCVEEGASRGNSELNNVRYSWNRGSTALMEGEEVTPSPSLQPPYLTSPVTSFPKLSKSLSQQPLRSPVFTRRDNTLLRHSSENAAAVVSVAESEPRSGFREHLRVL